MCLIGCNEEKKGVVDTIHEIHLIFEQNRLRDLKAFLDRRRCLNITNVYLKYLFHVVQGSGILMTSYAAGTNQHVLIWAGVSLNMFATLLHIFEKTNNSLLKQLLTDIQCIKNGTYVDEGQLIGESEHETAFTKLESYQHEPPIRS